MIFPELVNSYLTFYYKGTKKSIFIININKILQISSRGGNNLGV